MSPRALAAPMHRHTREDEYSYVLEGRVGALRRRYVAGGEPGAPWRFFPAGFERFFNELCGLGGVARAEPHRRRPRRRYGLEMDPASVPGR